MRIGFDAKRAFFNKSGLGNYSRDVIRSLDQTFPENEYFLYTPSVPTVQDFSIKNAGIVQPKALFSGRILQGYWRTFHLARLLEANKIDVYHGLSNEVPHGLRTRGTRLVVTIHDLIFLRYPEWYPYIDRKIYNAKFKYACKKANHIVAISDQTRKDLIQFYRIPEDKISVVYQSCNELFMHDVKSAKKKEVSKKYNLPERFLLYVGTIEERKNLLNIVKAMHVWHIGIPLVVVGRKTDYYKKVEAYIKLNSIKNVHFPGEVAIEDLPAIYQQAQVFIYPSLFEGFGIPILEALYSNVPVITTRGGCFSEVGGNSSVYIDPGNADEIAEAILYILNEPKVQKLMKEEGRKQAQKFTPSNMAVSLMEIYKKVLHAK